MRKTTGGLAVLSLALASGLVACSDGGGTDDTTGSAAATGDTTTAAEEYEIAFIQGVIGDEFYISMQCGVEAAAAELGATVTTQGPQSFDPVLQQPIVTSMVEAGPDALLIAPTDVTAMQRPLEEAAAAGIEVVLVDTTLSDPSFALSAIASDNVGGGRAAFEAMEQLVPDGGKVLVIGHQPGVSTTDLRIQGFEEAVAENDAFEYVGKEFAQNQPARAAQIVSATLQRYPDLVGIFATNIFSAEGAATGIEQAGRDDIVIIGFDAGPAQIKALEEDVIQAIIAQQPYDIGYQGVQQAIAGLTGGEVTAEIQTGFSVITQECYESGECADDVYMSSCG